ncbi:MAG: trypsin-like peptidase domain-containing protein [Saprospiraceae bacterium]|nr:trypsin-like peptidase domain-containing protein [Saprospiraceae bacterium]
MSSERNATLAAEHDILLSDRIHRAFSASAPTDFIEAARTCRESVVSIRASVSKDLRNYTPSTGSGVIFTSDGYLATNYHVVQNATEVNILLNDQRAYKGKIVGTDPSTDLALLKIEAENLPFLVFGNSDSLQIGEWVMAVGNPFRLQSTVTAGIVSAKARSINILENQGIESFIQTDAAVNPGNSGGALINTQGRLVGINTAIMSSSGNYEGFSFAIPSNLARKVLIDLKEFGAVQRGWLGIEITNVDQKMADRYGIKDVAGVFIASVAHKGGAHQAGLQQNDIILSVNDVKTLTTSSFMEQIAQYRPGDDVTVEFLREQQPLKLKVQLRNQLNTTDLIAIYKDQILKEIGIEIRDVDSNEKTLTGKKGVYVVSVLKNSIVHQTRMEPGYIITEINEREISSAKELLNILESLRGKNVILEGFYQNYPGAYPYSFQIPEL